MEIKGYKGFNPGLICKGKQYAENTTFEEPEANICRSGMHFCQNPMDVLEYYPIINKDGELNEFAEVTADGDAKTEGNNSCTTKLHIGAKLSFGGFVKACVDFLVEKTKSEDTSSGDYAQIGSSGYSAKIGSSGDSAKIGSSGRNSVICCAGNNSCAKAKVGSWITLAEWQQQGNEYIPVCVKTEKVDGERIKEDTWYTLKNGEFVEVQNG